MNDLKFEPGRVPKHTRDNLAAAILDRVAMYFDQPGVKEEFDAWLVEYRRRKEAVAS